MESGTERKYSLFVSLVVVTLLFAGLYWLSILIIDKLNSVNSDLGKAIVTAAATGFFAVLALVIGKAWEQRTKIQQDMREKKIPVYEKQIETFFAVRDHTAMNHAARLAF